MTKKKAPVPPEIEIARLQRDTAVMQSITDVIKQPLFQTIGALVLLETLQRHDLIGQNVSTALEVAITTKEAVGALAPVANFIPGIKL